MKRFFLSLCFVTFLSAGLVSCADEAAEVTPLSQEKNLNSDQYGSGDKGEGDDNLKPGSK
jgi:hypothetical protein